MCIDMLRKCRQHITQWRRKSAQYNLPKTVNKSAGVVLYIPTDPPLAYKLLWDLCGPRSVSTLHANISGIPHFCSPKINTSEMSYHMNCTIATSYESHHTVTPISLWHAVRCMQVWWHAGLQFILVYDHVVGNNMLHVTHVCTRQNTTCTL